jgi:Dictyostelium (slime mold) repeat
VPSTLSRRPALLALVLSAIVVAPSMASAHFRLLSPASWRDQDGLGSPQKLGPCGNEGTADQTRVVTTFSPGETITITLDETIFHPGHYRVALAVNDRSELPDEPAVTPGATACGSVPIAETPAFPVLADGVLVHTSPFSETQTIQVTLPSDVTCERCTLQVLEFMSNHGAPCFYHHCADISIEAGAGTPCTVDADCADGNACTTDRCDSESGNCEHVDIGPAACDDGNACTRDTCTAAEGCVTQPIALDDVSTGFLGTVEVPACSTDRVPPAIGALFRKADTFVARAAQSPSKAARHLNRASKRLRRAAKKAARASTRRLSAGCGTALAKTIEHAQVSVGCLLSR